MIMRVFALARHPRIAPPPHHHDDDADADDDDDDDFDEKGTAKKQTQQLTKKHLFKQTKLWPIFVQALFFIIH